MKKDQKLWTREELILAINLYCKLPFGRLHRRNPQVIQLAELIGRTPSAVAWKLVNFASLDPKLKARGIKGASHKGNLDEEIWNEFFDNWDDAFSRSEELLAEKSGVPVDKLYDEVVPLLEGKEKERNVKTRVNQSAFRMLVLANYNSTCCITGMDKPELIIASHIKPWSEDSKNRLNPKNGLALNALHDRAFDVGLITITPEYKIRVSKTLLKKVDNRSIKQNFIQYHDKSITLPKKFVPDPQFLDYHNNERFRE